MRALGAAAQFGADFSTAALISCSRAQQFGQSSLKHILFHKLSSSQSTLQLASRLFILRLAASLSHEVNVSDDHVLADRLAHVVDGEEGNGGSHEGLHLDPRLAGALHPGK